MNCWTAEDRKKYDVLKEQLTSQADHFGYLPGKHLKGVLEIGEIIVDLNVAEIVLQTYMRIIEEKKPDRDQSLKEFSPNREDPATHAGDDYNLLTPIRLASSG